MTEKRVVMKKREMKRRASTPGAEGESQKSRQGTVPGLDTAEFRGFLDLSSGMPVKHRCPMCHYEW